MYILLRYLKYMYMYAMFPLSLSHTHIYTVRTEIAKHEPSGLRTAPVLTPCLFIFPGDSLYDVNKICN